MQSPWRIIVAVITAVHPPCREMNGQLQAYTSRAADYVHGNDETSTDTIKHTSGRACHTKNAAATLNMLPT
jgi:hypothetical protein